MSTTVSSAQPTFRAHSSTGRERDLREPLAPTLAALVSPAVLKRHRKLTGSVDEARRKAIELRASVEAVKREDARAAERAVLEGKPIPAARAAQIEQEASEQERAADAVRSAVIASAEELLREAWPKANEALDAMRAEEDVAAEAVLGALEGLEEAIGRVAAIRDERAWMVWQMTRVVEEQPVEPYREGLDDVARGIARQTRAAVVELVETAAQRSDEQARNLAAIAEDRPKIAAQKERARREAKERAIIFEGLLRVEREPEPEPESHQ